jgi:hypothetical protein
VYVIGSTAYVLLPKWEKFTRFDAADLPLLMQYKWHGVHNRHKTLYARTSIKLADGRRVWKKMHQVLFPDAEEVDHLSHDTLDNRRAALRPCTPGQNNQNHPLRPRSGYRGVSKKGKCWIATISVGGKRIHIGSFESAEEAARARDKATVEHFGERLFLNFPDERLNETEDTSRS